jgi:hypothetical protein
VRAHNNLTPHSLPVLWCPGPSAVLSQLAGVVPQRACPDVPVAPLPGPTLLGGSLVSGIHRAGRRALWERVAQPAAGRMPPHPVGHTRVEPVSVTWAPLRTATIGFCRPCCPGYPADKGLDRHRLPGQTEGAFPQARLSARELARAPAGGNGAVEADHRRPPPAEAPSHVGRLPGTRGVDGGLLSIA